MACSPVRLSASCDATAATAALAELERAWRAADVGPRSAQGPPKRLGYLPPGPPPEPPARPRWRCAYCGNERADDGRSCSGCGAREVERRPEPRRPPPPALPPNVQDPPRRRRWWEVFVEIDRRDPRDPGRSSWLPPTGSSGTR